MPHTWLRCWRQYLENIFELFVCWRYEENSCAAASELERTIKVHDPMLRHVGWSCDLIFSPLRHEINYYLRFHGGARLEINAEGPSSNAHLEIRPVASRLLSISTNGKSVKTEILYLSK
jgi:hypothetical protein